MNLHLVQFQYSFELRGLTDPQFVQTFQDVIGRNLLTLIAELHPILYRIPEHYHRKE